jgi:hypothetical protein
VIFDDQFVVLFFKFINVFPILIIIVRVELNPMSLMDDKVDHICTL